MIGLLVTAALAGPCEPALVSDVQAHARTALAALEALDPPGFDAAAAKAFEAVDCLAEALPASVAAEVHQLRGLQATRSDDTAAAMRAFASARAAGAATLPDGLFPPDHPIVADYTAVDPDAGGTRPVGPPREGELRFDGTPGTRRPADRPTVFQHIVGREVTTSYVGASDALPEYAARRVRSPVEAPLLVTAGVGLAVAGGMLAAGAASHAGFQGLDTTTRAGQDALVPAQKRTNTLVVGAAVAGAVGVGAGLTGVAVIAW